jgi:AraC-like DNA-binding protein
MGKGDILLLNSREIHSISSVEKSNLCLFMQWNPALFLDVYDSVFRFSLNTAEKNDLPPESVSLFQGVLAEMGLLLYEKPDGYQFAIKSCLYRFISLLFSTTRYTISGQDEINTTNTYLEDFDKIQHYIRDHFLEEMTIDQLCSDVAMSRAKVFRILKASGSASIKNIQKFYRVEYAKNLLTGSELSIPRIAAESGFESDSSFYRVFKELTGLPPNQYRALPGEKAVPPGIQGYASYKPREAVKILKEYLVH